MDASGVPIRLLDDSQRQRMPIEARKAFWFFDREKRPTLDNNEMLLEMQRDRRQPDLATVQVRRLETMWDRCQLDEKERTPYERMAVDDSARWSEEGRFGVIEVVLPARAAADVPDSGGERVVASAEASVSVQSLRLDQSKELLSIVDDLRIASDRSLSSTGISGPILEMRPYGSIFEQPVSVSFDLASMLARAEEARRSSDDGEQDQGCFLLVLRQSGGEKFSLFKMMNFALRLTNLVFKMMNFVGRKTQQLDSPWLPLEESEQLTVDETGRATVLLRSFGRVTCRLFSGAKAAEQAAKVATNALKLAAVDVLVTGNATEHTVNTVVKYAGVSAAAGLSEVASFPVATGGIVGFHAYALSGVRREIGAKSTAQFAEVLQKLLAEGSWDAMLREPKQEPELSEALRVVRPGLEPHVVIAGLTWSAIEGYLLKGQTGGGEVLAGIDHAIEQLKAQLPSLLVAHLGRKIGVGELAAFNEEYEKKNQLVEIWLAGFGACALKELHALFPHMEPPHKSRLQIALDVNHKLKDIDQDLDAQLVAVMNQRVKRAEEISDREALLAQMLPDSTLTARYKEVQGLDKRLEDKNNKYKAGIVAKQQKLEVYRAMIADQEKVMLEREEQLRLDLERLKAMNATLDRLQGGPMSLLMVPPELAAEPGTVAAKRAPPPATEEEGALEPLTVGSPAAAAFLAKCRLAQESVTPEEKTELAVVTLQMAKQGNEVAIREALSRGADPNAANPKDDDETVMFFAAKAGHAQCVEALLTAGSDVDRGGNQGWTPLMHAVNGHYTEVCRVLLAHSADMSAADVDDKRTALDIAVNCVEQAVQDEEEEEAADARGVLAMLQAAGLGAG